MTTANKLIWYTELYHQAVKTGIFDEQNIELLEGELIQMSPEGEPHANRISQSVRYLIRQLGNKADVRDGHPVTLSPTSEPEPDIAIVEDLGREYDTHHPYPSNIFLIIEFAYSSLEQDLGQKRLIYALAEIQEYWVVNLKDSQVHIYRQPTEGDYQYSEIVNSGQISPIAFPDISVDISFLLTQ
ncbi:MAG: Uma2 family endonuclease [Microcoleaceae cyanobacterium]